MTAAHVVWRACHITVETSGGQTLNAQILGLDLQGEDLALLSVPGLTQVSFQVATAPVTPGAMVIAVWSPMNPLAAGHATVAVTSIAGVATVHLTLGVSGVSPITGRGRLVLWAPEYTGASGAPVFDTQGRVIGVVEGGAPPGSPGSVAIPVVAGLTELRAWAQEG
ncbi:MAG: S1 family peptidase [Candidatus Dormibacteria bacterium]